MTKVEGVICNDNYKLEKKEYLLKQGKNTMNEFETGEKKTDEDTNKSLTEEELSNPEKLKNYINKKNQKFLETFELLNMIGSGSEACAYKVNIKRKNYTIISKMIRKEKRGAKDKEEIKISQKLKNKYIINTFFGSTVVKDELDCIMMEYARYGNLRDFQKNILKRTILSESLLCYIAYHVLNGLKYMHMSKIAHFDIKPQNIVIDEFLNIKIIDFSVALDYKEIKGNKIKLPFRGTNFYIPPEAIKSKTINVKDLNKIDLYSLGVILYNFAFGCYPFDLSSEDSKDYDKIYNKIMKEWEVKDENHIYSTHFIDFLKKILKKNIGERMSLNEACNHYWIKGANLLMNEKEKIYNVCNFLSYLITDNIISFNAYIKNESKFLL